MIKLNVQITNTITPMLKKQIQQLNKLPDQAYKVFVKNTPVRTGNARRNTKLKGKKEIRAEYAYAQRLDEGYSQQSPDGMIQPTTDFIVAQFNKIMTGK